LRKKQLIKELNNYLETDVSQKIFSTTKTVTSLPSSSVFCYGNEASNRICKFRNFCYYKERETFVFVLGNASTKLNSLKGKENRLLDLTSLDGHSAFFFNYNEVTPEFFSNKKV